MIEAGRMKLCPVTIHFASFLEGIANIIRLRAEAKHLAFHMQKTDSLPQWVMGDETRLRQILLNLLGNAVKFTHAGQVSLCLECRDMPADVRPIDSIPRTFLRFEVKDTGIGIAKNQIDRIFQPFEQVRRVEHEDAAGTGLGLAISRQLVHLMGGQLHVESESGRGSTFWFDLVLPLSDTAEVCLPPPEKIIRGYTGPRMRLLIADDIASNRAVLVDMLAILGFEIFEAMDGRQAVHLARETRPDLILMDLRMPGMDGFEAAWEIRKIAGLEKVAIIAITASVSEQSQIECRQARIDAFLAKPVRWPRLAALMEEHLKIKWVYAQKSRNEGIEEKGDWAPPRKELDILMEMARRGNLRAIHERACRLEKMDARLKPFARRLRQLSQTFEEKAVMALINRYLKEQPHEE
jgi:CheY-like chemotaxis protein